MNDKPSARRALRREVGSAIGDELPMRPFARSLPMQLLRAREALMQRFRPMLHAHGVTEQQWRVIRALMEIESPEIGALADACCVLPASLTRIVDTLEEKGLATRRRNTADQRRVIVAITPAGRHLFHAVAPHSEANYREIAALMGQDRIDAFYAMLQDFIARLETPADGTNH